MPWPSPLKLADGQVLLVSEAVPEHLIRAQITAYNSPLILKDTAMHMRPVLSLRVDTLSLPGDMVIKGPFPSLLFIDGERAGLIVTDGQEGASAVDGNVAGASPHCGEGLEEDLLEEIVDFY